MVVVEDVFIHRNVDEKQTKKDWCSSAWLALLGARGLVAPPQDLATGDYACIVMEVGSKGGEGRPKWVQSMHDALCGGVSSFVIISIVKGGHCLTW